MFIDETDGFTALYSCTGNGSNTSPLFKSLDLIPSRRLVAMSLLQSRQLPHFGNDRCCWAEFEADNNHLMESCVVTRTHLQQSSSSPLSTSPCKNRAENMIRSSNLVGEENYMDESPWARHDTKLTSHNSVPERACDALAPASFQRSKFCLILMSTSSAE